MTDILPRIEGASIVVVGSFQPYMFQPAWLAQHDLIEPEAVDVDSLHIQKPDSASKSEIMQLSDMQIGWLHLVVLPDRLAAHSADPSYELPLRDFVVGVLSLLEHTPVKRMGFMHRSHYQMPTPEAWHELGNRLAPQDQWSGIVDNAGLRRLTVMRRNIEPNAEAVPQVTVEPSQRIQHGVYLEISRDHPRSNSTAKARDIMTKTWDDFLAWSRESAKRIVGLGVQ